jgi:uncharacterized protein (TIGR02611 family)
MKSGVRIDSINNKDVTRRYISTKLARKIIIAIVGFTILLIGLAMTVLPGPAFIVIPVGLGILATEFMWAKSILNKVKTKFQQMKKDVLYK